MPVPSRTGSRNPPWVDGDASTSRSRSPWWGAWHPPRTLSSYQARRLGCCSVIGDWRWWAASRCL
jgi:hypothetical protein